MSGRTTHIKTFDVSQINFKTYGDALKKADAIKKFIEYICKKNNYSCIAYIGVSEHDNKYSVLYTEKNGKRVFKNYPNKCDKKIGAHIHITLVANPCETVIKKLQEYFSKQQDMFAEPLYYSKNCEDYLEIRIPYVVEQCSNFRMVNTGNQEILEPYISDFCNLLESNYKRIGYKKTILKNR